MGTTISSNKGNEPDPAGACTADCGDVKFGPGLKGQIAGEHGIGLLQKQLPLKLRFFDSECNEVRGAYNQIFINQEEVMLRDRIQNYQLDRETQNSIDMRFSCVQGVEFTNRPNVRFIDVSHTFICHLNARQLVDLEELRLMNTNIKRLNLAKQRKLKVLHCNYTLINYLNLLDQSLISELCIEYSGQQKSNRISVSGELTIDERQIVDDYRCRSSRKCKMKLCDVSYAEKRNNGEECRIQLPRKCDEFCNRNIRQCRRLTLHGLHQYNVSEIDFLDVVDYFKLEELVIQHIKCYCLHIADLVLLASSEISYSLVDYISIANTLNLKKVKIVKSYSLMQLSIEGCGKLEELDVSHTGITQLDVSGLGQLKSLDISFTKINSIDVSHNGKLEQLAVYNTEIADLDVSQLTELKLLHAFKTNLTQVDVSRNLNLEQLSVHNTKISQLDVAQIKQLIVLQVHDTSISQIDLSANTELKALYACDTGITQLDVSRNSKLEDLAVFNTRISRLDVSRLAELRELQLHNTAVTQLDVSGNAKLEILSVDGSEVSRLDVSCLTRLQRLFISKTSIGQIDLSGNPELAEVWASSGCRVLGCCCRVNVCD